MLVDEVCDAALSENVEGKTVKDPILPKFILAGVSKCGTTAIKNAILKHPQVVPVLNGRTHFFNIYWKDDLPANVQMAKYAELFQQDVLSNNPNMCSGDFCAGYILGVGKVARRIKENIPGVKVIIALRDPVARTLSSYNYARANMNTVLELMGAESYTESFLDMTKRQITEIDNAGINPDTDVEKCEYYRRLCSPEALNESENLIRHTDALKSILGKKGAKQTGEQGVTQPPKDVARRKVCEALGISHIDDIESVNVKLLKFRKTYSRFVANNSITVGMYALLLEPWFEVFGSDLHVVSTDSLAAESYGKTINSIFSHIGLSPYETPYGVMNAGSYLYVSEEDEEAKALLREWYKPYNAKLAKLLEKYSVDTSSGLWPWLHADDTATSMNNPLS